MTGNPEHLIYLSINLLKPKQTQRRNNYENTIHHFELNTCYQIMKICPFFNLCTRSIIKDHALGARWLEGFNKISSLPWTWVSALNIKVQGVEFDSEPIIFFILILWETGTIKLYIKIIVNILHVISKIVAQGTKYRQKKNFSKRY